MRESTKNAEILLSPSILAADFHCLGEEVERLEKAGCTMIHLDVMDGSFVPNISFGAPVIQSLRPHSKAMFDCHLMVQEPRHLYPLFQKAGVDGLTIHVEAVKDVIGDLCLIREMGIQPAISIRPDTDTECLRPYLPYVDMVLLMSVMPGFGGQKFLPESLERLQKICRMREEEGLSFHLEIDGGVGRDNFKDVLLAGADRIVMGTSIFRGNVEENIAYYERVIEEISL